MPPHRDVPTGQTQLPPTQLFPPAHATPHPPQFALSTVVFVSQPLAATLSQLACPTVQAATLHAPLTQLAVALGSEQGVPHEPQWAISFERLKHAAPQGE